jgi:hypothetical protein
MVRKGDDGKGIMAGFSSRFPSGVIVINRVSVKGCVTEPGAAAEPSRLVRELHLNGIMFLEMESQVTSLFDDS